MLRFIAIFSALCASFLATANAQTDPAPLAYKAASGDYRATLVTSAIGTDGTPIVSAYKGLDGAYHATLVVAQTCSLDSNGFPLLCADTGGGSVSGDYLPLTGGTLTGALVGTDSTFNSLTLTGGGTTSTVTGSAGTLQFSPDTTISTGPADPTILVSSQTAAYTPNSADCGTTIEMNAAAGLTFTVPSDLATGCRIDVVQAGAGAVTVSPRHRHDGAGAWWRYRNVRSVGCGAYPGGHGGNLYPVG
ncbi:hypothetical protein [Komagataeibacter europaeus]|uniref:hypothetical protein n=1 Tax=Komagataeibacter europaeus TaxID=33995 RepID=UPI0015F7DDAC|nr:hypothetical protein [Komagataeibacter europaeus]